MGRGSVIAGVAGLLVTEGTDENERASVNVEAPDSVAENCEPQKTILRLHLLSIRELPKEVVHTHLTLKMKRMVGCARGEIIVSQNDDEGGAAGGRGRGGGTWCGEWWGGECHGVTEKNLKNLFELHLICDPPKIGSGKRAFLDHGADSKAHQKSSKKYGRRRGGMTQAHHHSAKGSI